MIEVSRTYLGKAVPVSRVAVSEKGVLRLAAGGRDLPPFTWLVKAPLKAGDTWSVDLHTLANGHLVRAKYTVRGTEELDVPAGKFKAVRIDSVIGTDGIDGGSFWYAPGVGLVKSVTKIGEADRVQSLKSFGPAKK